MADDERPPEKTPWGPKQEEWEDMAGFWWVSTPGHGGIYLKAEQRKDIPDLIKPHSSDAEGVWWEEDSAWSLPIVCLLSQRPHGSLSDEEKYVLEQAHDTARDSFPDEWEQIIGREIKPGESYNREEGREIALIHTDDLLAGAIWRSSSENAWVPEGMVGVAAYPGKAFLDSNMDPARAHAARYFLIPEAEAKWRTLPFEFNVARHKEVTGREGTPPTQPREGEVERLKSQSPGNEPQRETGSVKELTIKNLTEDPWLVVDHPIPETADPQLLKAARAAAVVCLYEAEDLIASDPKDPRSQDLKKIDAIFTDIRHRLGEPEPEPLPLAPGMENTLNELEKTWNAQPQKQRDRERER
jgi:hypothetical protein